jgi:hypothetical protein
VTQPGVVAVDPYPFREPFDVGVDATAIPVREYESEEDLHAAVAAGRRLSLTCELRPA